MLWQTRCPVLALPSPINTYKYLQGGCWEDGARLCSVVPSDRTRGNGHKQKQRKFQLNTRKNFFPLRVTEPWPRLPREAVESPSLEIFQPRLDAVLCSLLWVTLLGQEIGLGDPQRSLPTPTMLGFGDSIPAPHRCQNQAGNLMLPAVCPSLCHAAASSSSSNLFASSDLQNAAAFPPTPFLKPN